MYKYTRQFFCVQTETKSSQMTALASIHAPLSKAFVYKDGEHRTWHNIKSHAMLRPTEQQPKRRGIRPTQKIRHAF